MIPSKILKKSNLKFEQWQLISLTSIKYNSKKKKKIENSQRIAKAIKTHLISKDYLKPTNPKTPI